MPHSDRSKHKNNNYPTTRMNTDNSLTTEGLALFNYSDIPSISVPRYLPSTESPKIYESSEEISLDSNLEASDNEEDDDDEGGDDGEIEVSEDVIEDVTEEDLEEQTNLDNVNMALSNLDQGNNYQNVYIIQTC